MQEEQGGGYSDHCPEAALSADVQFRARGKIFQAIPDSGHIVVLDLLY